MKNEKCQNCRNYIPDEEQPRCAVPIWSGAELFTLHYTLPNKWCALYEKAEDSNETERH